MEIRKSYGINPIQSFVLRIAASIVTPVLYWGLIMLVIDHLTNLHIDSGTRWVSFLIAMAGLGLASFFSKQVDVPINHAAIPTFLGERIGFVHLSEGMQYVPLLLGINISTSPLPDPEGNRAANSPEGQGFVFMGSRPMTILEKVDGKDNEVQNLSRDNVQIGTRALLVLIVLHALSWAKSDNPTGAILGRARSALRSAISFFLSTDLNSVKSLLGSLMMGDTILVARVPKGSNFWRQGALIRDRSGTRLHETIPEAASASEGKTIQTRFAQSLLAKGDKAMLEAAGITDQETALAAIEELTVAEHLRFELSNNGADDVSVSVEEISLPEEITKAAESPQRELLEREGQMLNAETQRDTRHIIERDKDGNHALSAETAAMLAAAVEGTVQVVHVSGSGDRLTKAAAIIAGGKNKEKK